MSDMRWMLDMTAEPVIPAWKTSSECRATGSELQRAIIKGFSENGDPVYSKENNEFTFEKTFTAKDHGEFFRGALTMAGLRYAGDFYELLQRYGAIKVTIVKAQREVK